VARVKQVLPEKYIYLADVSTFVTRVIIMQVLTIARITVRSLLKAGFKISSPKR
jgi:hypothetical protein